MKYKYLNKYSFKIKKVEEISKIVGKFNSERKYQCAMECLILFIPVT